MLSQSPYTFADFSEIPSISVQGAKLSFRTFGDNNKEPIIIVHGGPGLSMDYLLSLKKLAEDHFVIFYDQRGNGNSTGAVNSDTMNLETFTNDLLAVQDFFKLEKATIAGHSWGAYLAMHYAAQYPDRVQKLVLLNSIPIQKEKTNVKDYYESLMQSIVDADSSKNTNDQAMMQMYKDGFKGFFHDANLANQVELNMTADQVIRSAKIHQLFEENFFHPGYDLRGRLENIKHIPTLIIHGNGNDIPAFEAEEIKKCIPDAQFNVIDSGHFPFIENPKALFKHWHEFDLQHLDLSIKNVK